MTSELSRGFWIIGLFAIIGFFQVAPVVFNGLPWAADGTMVKTIMGALSVLIIINGFMTMNVVRALPLWNSSVIIPLSLASGIWIGSQATELMLYATDHNIAITEIWSRWSLLSYMAFLLLYLWATYHSSDNAKGSIKKILAGHSAFQFYVLVLTIGLILPLAITASVWRNDVTNVPGILLFARFLFVLIGDLMMRRIIMVGAIYSPIL